MNSSQDVSGILGGTPPTVTVKDHSLFGASPNSGSPSSEQAEIRLGATSQDMSGAAEYNPAHSEYEWAATLKDAALVFEVPELYLNSFNFEQWQKDLLSTMVGKTF